MSDLDAILDAALDQFDAHTHTTATTPNDSNNPSSTTSTCRETSSAPSVNVDPSSSSASPTTSASTNSTSTSDPDTLPSVESDPASIAAFETFLRAMMTPEMMAQQNGKDGAPSGDIAEMHKEMNEMLQQMAQMAKQTTPNTSASASAAAEANTSAATSTTAEAASSTSTVSSASSSDPINDAIRMISDGARSMPSNGPGGMGFPPGMDDANMEAMLSKLMAEMGAPSGGAGGANGAPGGDDAINAMVEQMMGSMLSKEHLYQPMKDIADKYPAYIRENEDKLSPEELSNYRKQHDCFNRIVHLFETEPNASMKIMDLMTEMQQYGTPPKELSADFMPPGFDPTHSMPPGMAALAGMGGANGDANSSAPPTAEEMEQFKKMTDEACKMQ